MSTTHATGASALAAPSYGGPLALSPLPSAGAIAAAYLTGYSAATREAYARDLRAWGRFLECQGLDPLAARRAHVDAFVREAEEAGAAPATMARRLSALAGFYAYALDEGAVDRSPVARVRRPRVSDLSPRLGVDRDGVRALLGRAAESSPRDHALVALLALSGLRISEALEADAADLGAERGHRTLRVRRKGGSRQTLALAPRTAAALDSLLDGREAGPIFATRTGRRLDRHAARKTVRRLAREAGIAHTVSPHGLRHGFCTLALDSGVSLRDTQDAMGHADPRTTRRYDRARGSLDRSATYSVAAYVA